MMMNSGGNPMSGSPNLMMYAGWGSQVLTGGDGIDTVVFPGMHSDFMIDRTAQGCTVTGLTVSIDDTLVGIERLKFSDMKLAFDDAAANTAKLIGAAFGMQFIQPALNGTGISLFDQGNTMQDVAAMALAAMAGADTNEHLVNMLYTNVVGHAPDAASLMYYVDMLDHGMTRVDMLMLAANSDANAQHIDLVGIMSHGLQYL